MRKKEISLPAKALYANYRAGTFEFAASQKAADKEIFTSIALPPWAVKAIEEEITCRSNIAITNHNRKIKGLLDI